MDVKFKRRGTGVEFRAFDGKSGRRYLVMHTRRGAYHVFAEMQAKDAAIDCGAPDDRDLTTRQLWQPIWNR